MEASNIDMLLCVLCNHAKYSSYCSNQQWALSGECEDEYNLAKRLNLTSHEKGRTQRTERRLPIMMPIAFPNLDWDGHPHVQLLAASTNFIVHNTDDLLSGNSAQTLDDVAKAIISAGISIDESRSPTYLVQSMSSLSINNVSTKVRKWQQSPNNSFHFYLELLIYLNLLCSYYQCAN